LAEAGAPSPAAYLGLARAHEALQDCAAAVRAYEAYLERFPESVDGPSVHARRGACEAELGKWEASAASYARALEADSLLPSARVEALARRGYALFMLDRFDPADTVLAEADRVFDRAQTAGTERFGTYYFVGMARFYRAAILHRRFRQVEIRLPETVMKQGYLERLDLLARAQEAYNHTIRAKHMFWVSAAGYQLGSLFEEFYDAMMHAPVPSWLDSRQRKIYYEELKKQLRPAVNKAIWVFEKNLETARRLGYESPFIERTEAKLSALQAVLLAGDETWGRPHPRLVPEALAEVAPPEEGAGTADELDAMNRKLFVPRPTAL
jgi:tetratricopeptide (TPR) repeat protein